MFVKLVVWWFVCNIFLIVCLIIVVFFFNLNECLSNIVVDKIVVIGLVLFWLVISGVELWIGLYRDGLLVVKFVDGNIFNDFVSIEVLLFKILLNIFLVIIILKYFGLWINCIVVEFISICLSFIFG